MDIGSLYRELEREILSFHIIVFYSVFSYTVTYIFRAKYENTDVSLLIKYLDWVVVNSMGFPSLYFLFSSSWYIPYWKMPFLLIVALLSTLLFIDLVLRRPTLSLFPERYRPTLLFILTSIAQALVIATLLPAIYFLPYFVIHFL